jgi:hypothetical protein
MRFHLRVPRRPTQDLTNWHYHFAWLPVCIGGSEYAWLEGVERRIEFGVHDNFVYYRNSYL